MEWCAIGDIHGHYDALIRLEEFVLRMYPRIRFIYNGDYVDRGPDSLKVLEHVRQRVSEGHIALKGNHELYLEEYLLGEFNEYSYQFGQATLKSLDPSFFPSMDFVDIMQTQQRIASMHTDILAFLQSLKLMHEEGDTVFIHGGFNPFRSHYSQSTEMEMTSPSWKMPTHAGMYPEKQFVFGHVHASDYHQTDNTNPYKKKNMTFIDGGAGSNKRLNAYFDDGTHVSTGITIPV